MIQKHRPTFSSLMAFALLVGLAACTDDPAAPDAPGSPPELPPLTSMSGDFSIFQSPSAQLVEFAPVANASAQNFANAALRVFAAQVVTVAGLAVPVATFAAAANGTPVFEDDGRWHWRFSTVQGGQTYTAHLSGSVEASEVAWDMRITSPTHAPPLDEFLWYGGRGALDGRSGSWTFHDPGLPTASNELLRIDWTHASFTKHGWEATALGGSGQGDVFTVAVDGPDHLLTYADASEGTFLEIYWNGSDGTGYLIAPNYNGGERACWGAAQQDVPCA